MLWHRWKEHQKIDGVYIKDGAQARFLVLPRAQFLVLAQVEGSNNGHVLEHNGVCI